MFAWIIVIHNVNLLTCYSFVSLALGRGLTNTKTTVTYNIRLCVEDSSIMCSEDYETKYCPGRDQNGKDISSLNFTINGVNRLWRKRYFECWIYETLYFCNLHLTFMRTMFNYCNNFSSRSLSKHVPNIAYNFFQVLTYFSTTLMLNSS